MQSRKRQFDSSTFHSSTGTQTDSAPPR
nr:unnamed protein product [Callosobruchus chinensis]